MAKAETQQKEGGFAVIETGGKQYRVSMGDVITIETTKDTEVGKKITFDKVLLKGNGDKLEMGFPMLDKAEIEGEVLEEGKGKKVLVMKYKSKSRYFRKKGHRQPFQKVRITKI